MRVAIRVDAATWMGIGHLKRCMALADALRRAGADVLLVCRRLDATAPALLAGSEMQVAWLREPVVAPVDAGNVTPLPAHHVWARVDWLSDAADTCAAVERTFVPDWVLIDHYAFDARWHGEVRRRFDCQLAVIDDLADRALNADLLIDHNWCADHRAKYAERLPAGTPILGGPKYALLDRIYADAPKYAFHRDVRSIGVFMGGTDPGNVSSRIIAACRAGAGFAGPIEVVSSAANPHLEQLRRICATWPDTTLTVDLPDLSAFFAAHDLQVGAGGGATWERCCIGVPSILLAAADNQQSVVTVLAQRGVAAVAALPAPSSANDTEEVLRLAQAVKSLIGRPDARRQLAERAALLVDGRGAARVALCLMQAALDLRRATLADAGLLHAWRNQESVRVVSGNPAPIAYDDHVRWLEQVLGDPHRWLYLGHINGQPVGSIRFDDIEEHADLCALEVSLYLDPGLQGIGLGKALLAAGERAMQEVQRSPFVVHAEVVAGNSVSQRLFQRGGYADGPLHFTKSFDARSARHDSGNP